MCADKTLEVKKAVMKTVMFIVFQRSFTQIHTSESIKNVLSSHRPEAPFFESLSRPQSLSYSFSHTFTPLRSTSYQSDTDLGLGVQLVGTWVHLFDCLTLQPTWHFHGLSFLLFCISLYCTSLMPIRSHLQELEWIGCGLKNFIPWLLFKTFPWLPFTY